MKIVWSALAKDYYIFIIEQLFEKWNIDIVELFENETVELILSVLPSFVWVSIFNIKFYTINH